MQCMEWLQDDAGDEDAVGVGDDPWVEDEPVHLCICYGLKLCVPQKFHIMKS